MQALRTERISPDAYLEWERAQPTRNEYYDGMIYAMTGGTLDHANIGLNIAAALKQLLRGGPCRPYNTDVRVHVDRPNAFFYPDVTVTCDPTDLTAKESIRAPKVIFEVLSPSTSACDRGDKFAAYRALESLQDYVLVDPDTKRVERFSRNADGSWQLVDATGTAELTLPSLSVVLPLAVIFENVG